MHWAKDPEATVTTVGNMVTQPASAKARAKEDHQHWEHSTKAKEKARPTGSNSAKAKEANPEGAKAVRKEVKDSKENVGHAGSWDTRLKSAKEKAKAV